MDVHSGQLERAYRRLLRVYPRSYRQQRGEEMLATLLDTAPPGQTRPTAGDVADIARGALRERLGLAAVPGFSAGLRVAGPVSLAVTAAFPVSLWLLGTRTPASTVVAAAWLAAVAVSALAPRLAAWSVSIAWLATVGAAIAAALAPAPIQLGWPTSGPVGLYPLTLVGGLIATLAVLTRTDRPSTVERWSVPAGAAALLVATAVRDLAHTGGSVLVQAPSWLTVAQYGPAALVLVGLAVWALRRSTALLWSGLILLVAVPILWLWAYHPETVYLQFRGTGVVSGTVNINELCVFQTDRFLPDYIPALSPLIQWGGLFGAAILAGVLLAAVAAAAQHRRDPARDGRAALGSLAPVSLGLASGMGLLALATWAQQGNAVPRDVVAAAVPVVAAVLAMLVPARLGRVLLAIAAVTIAVIGYTAGVAVPQSYVVTVVLLLTVAAATVRTGGRVATALVAVATLAGLAAAFDVTTVGVGDLLWRVYGGDPMPLYAAAGIALIPTLVWAPVVVVRSHGGWLPGLVAMAAALVWLPIEVDYTTADASTFIVAVASCVVLFGFARLATRPMRRRRAV